MSQANHANTTAERAAPTRRALLCTAPVALAATLPDFPLLGPLLPAAPEIPFAGNDGAPSDLAEVRRLIAELIAIDDEVAEADEANDAEREAAAQARHDFVYAQFRERAAVIQATRPRGWLDIVVRAEIAAYLVIWKNSRSDWDQLAALIDIEGCDETRANASLALGVLWLANREGGKAHV